MYYKLSNGMMYQPIATYINDLGNKIWIIFDFVGVVLKLHRPNSAIF